MGLSVFLEDRNASRVKELVAVFDDCAVICGAPEVCREDGASEHLWEDLMEYFNRIMKMPTIWIRLSAMLCVLNP